MNFLATFILLVFFYTLVLFFLKRHIVFLFMVWFGHFWMSVSSAYIESGIYVTEQKAWTYENGSTYALMLFEFVFWSGVVFSIRIFAPRTYRLGSFKFNRRLVVNLLLAVCFALSLLLVNVLLTGAPILSEELTRFNFWSESKLKFLNIILGNVAAPLLVVLGVVFAISKMNDEKFYARFSFWLFFVFIVYYFLIGQKFSMQLLALSLFAPPYLYLRALRYGSFGVQFRHLMIIIFVVLLAILFILYSYSRSHEEFILSQGGLIAAFLYRLFGLQGHVWWGAYEAVEKSGTLAFDLSDFVNGMTTLMYVVAPKSIADAYISSGIRFTMGYPAIIYVYLGSVITCALQFVFGAVLGGLVSYSEHQIVNAKILSAACVLIVLGAVTIFFNMGELADLFSLKVFGPIILAALLIVLPKKNRSFG